jgi:acetyl-CoA decarbonylase/synthase complex subunit gamma
MGAYKARWGINRTNYMIDPGLYALGDPDSQSPVLVTANYKMSFDRLRETLPSRNLWILVLDTKGINVWCASGKGTFGTNELVSRIESSGLSKVVSHRELILPQLSGPGVAAHHVKKLSGFKVIYGPIRAKDLPTFLDGGLKATPEMRLKTFTTWERIALIPIELVQALRAGIVMILILFLLSFLGKLGEGWINALSHGLFSVVAILSAILAGAVLTPVLLPWLPGRAFSLKGVGLGLLGAIILTAFHWDGWMTIAGRLEIIAWLLLIPALSAYLAMNFTGASTYTSLSGVKKEMRWALPLQISAAIVGLILWLGSQFV